MIAPQSKDVEQKETDLQASMDTLQEDHETRLERIQANSLRRREIKPEVSE